MSDLPRYAWGRLIKRPVKERNGRGTACRALPLNSTIMNPVIPANPEGMRRESPHQGSDDNRRFRTSAYRRIAGMTRIRNTA
jgi:hypothetical protein